MKRRDSFILNGLIIGFAIVAILDTVLQYFEKRNEGEKLNWNNLDGIRVFKRATLGGLIGGGIGYASYRFQIQKELSNPINSEDYLKNILIQENLKSDPAFFNQVISVKKELKEFLWNEFKNDLVIYPDDVGSFHKRTALLSNFDLDIVLPFKKKNNTNSLGDIYEEVLFAIEEKYSSRHSVFRQNKTIGLTLENKGRSIHFDIIPGREVNDYKKDKEIYLFVNRKSFFGKPSHFKTNIEKQKKATINKPKVREVIKLLKKYKDINNYDIPSIVLERYALKALSSDAYGVASSKTTNLLNSMAYISDKIVQNELIDSANSNNNLLDKSSISERQKFASRLKQDIQRIEESPSYIKKIF